MLQENVFIGTIKKYDQENHHELTEETDAILIKIGRIYVKLESIYKDLSLAFSLFNIGLLTYPTTEQELYIDDESLRHYYPEEERHHKLSLKNLKNN